MVKSISCNEAMSKLQAYLDNEVDWPGEEEIHHHIENCRECFSRTEFEKALRDKVEKLGTEKTPADVQARLSAMIKKF